VRVVTAWPDAFFGAEKLAEAAKRRQLEHDFEMQQWVEARLPEDQAMFAYALRCDMRIQLERWRHSPATAWRGFVELASIPRGDDNPSKPIMQEVLAVEALLRFLGRCAPWRLR
jgi:hypothetical protein